MHAFYVNTYLAGAVNSCMLCRTALPRKCLQRYMLRLKTRSVSFWSFGRISALLGCVSCPSSASTKLQRSTCAFGTPYLLRACICLVLSCASPSESHGGTCTPYAKGKRCLCRAPIEMRLGDWRGGRAADQPALGPAAAPMTHGQVCDAAPSLAQAGQGCF